MARSFLQTDVDVLLGVSVQLGSKMRVVEEQLKSLLGVVVAKILKSGFAVFFTGRCGRILETWRVNSDDRTNRTGR